MISFEFNFSHKATHVVLFPNMGYYQNCNSSTRFFIYYKNLPKKITHKNQFQTNGSKLSKRNLSYFAYLLIYEFLRNICATAESRNYTNDVIIETLNVFLVFDLS